MEYEPFGRIYQPGSSGQDVFRPKYGDQELERDSGLYYFKARYYDPDLGRFLTPDRSLGAHPLHNSALNRYAYVGNNPVSYTDPSGKFTEIGAIVGMMVATVAGALIAGTEGKILSDTTHAFDNWSWEGALVGAFTGWAIGAISFTLGMVGGSGFGGATLGMVERARTPSSTYHLDPISRRRSTRRSWERSRPTPTACAMRTAWAPISVLLSWAG